MVWILDCTYQGMEGIKGMAHIMDSSELSQVWAVQCGIDCCEVLMSQRKNILVSMQWCGCWTVYKSSMEGIKYQFGPYYGRAVCYQRYGQCSPVCASVGKPLAASAASSVVLQQ